MIPLLPNKQGKTAFWQMHESGQRILADLMMNKMQFHRIIRGQSEVGELLQ